MKDKHSDALSALVAKVHKGTLGLVAEPRLQGQPKEVLERWVRLRKPEILKLGSDAVEYYFTSATALDTVPGILSKNPAYVLKLGGKTTYCYRVLSEHVGMLAQQAQVADLPMTLYNPKKKGAVFPVFSESELQRPVHRDAAVFDVVRIDGEFGLLIRNGSENHLNRLFENAGLSSKKKPVVEHIQFRNGLRVGLVRPLPQALAESIARAHGSTVRDYGDIGHFYREESRAERPAKSLAIASKRERGEGTKAEAPPSYRNEAELRDLCRAFHAKLEAARDGHGVIHYSITLQARIEAGHARHLDSKLAKGSLVAGFIKTHFGLSGAINQPGDTIRIPVGVSPKHNDAIRALFNQRELPVTPYSLPSSCRQDPHDTHKLTLGRTKRPLQLYPYMADGEHHALLVVDSLDLTFEHRLRLHADAASILYERAHTLGLPCPKPLSVLVDAAHGDTPRRFAVDLRLHPAVYERLATFVPAIETPQALAPWQVFSPKEHAAYAPAARAGKRTRSPSDTLTQQLALLNQFPARSYFVQTALDQPGTGYFMLTPEMQQTFLLQAAELGFNVKHHYKLGSSESPQLLVSIALPASLCQRFAKSAEGASRLSSDSATPSMVVRTLKARLGYVKSPSLESDQANLLTERDADRSLFARVRGADGITPHAFYLMHPDKVKRFAQRAKDLGMGPIKSYGITEGPRKQRLAFVGVALSKETAKAVNDVPPQGRMPRFVLAMPRIHRQLSQRSEEIIAEQKKERDQEHHDTALVPRLVKMLTSGKAALVTVELPELARIDELIARKKMLDGNSQLAQNYHDALRVDRASVRAYTAAVAETIPGLSHIDAWRRKLEASSHEAAGAVQQSNLGLQELAQVRQIVTLYGTHVPCLAMRGHKNQQNSPEWLRIIHAIERPDLTVEGQDDQLNGRMDSSKRGVAGLSAHARAVLRSQQVTLSKGMVQALLLSPALAQEVEALAHLKLGNKPVEKLSDKPVRWSGLDAAIAQHFEPQIQEPPRRSIVEYLEELGMRAVIGYERQNNTAEGKRVADDQKGAQPVLYLVVNKHNRKNVFDLLERLRGHSMLGSEKLYDRTEQRSPYGEEMVRLHAQAVALHQAQEGMEEYEHRFFGDREALIALAACIAKGGRIRLPDTARQTALDLKRLVEQPLEFISTEETRATAELYFMPAIVKAIGGEQQALLSVLDDLSRGPVEESDVRMDALRHFLKYMPSLKDRVDDLHGEIDEALRDLREQFPDDEQLTMLHAATLHGFPVSEEQAVARYGVPEVMLYTRNTPDTIPCLVGTDELKKRVNHALDTEKNGQEQVILRCPLVTEMFAAQETMLRPQREAVAKGFMAQLVEQQRDGRPVRFNVVQESTDEDNDEKVSHTQRVKLRSVANHLRDVARDHSGRDGLSTVQLLGQYFEVALNEKVVSLAAQRAIA